MKSKASLAGAVLALLLFAGCVGTPFRWDTARQIKVGMSEAQVIELMGKPLTMSAADGKEYWTWNYGTGIGTGGYFRIVLKNRVVTEVPEIPHNL